jgi:hypothetical protein
MTSQRIIAWDPSIQSGHCAWAMGVPYKNNTGLLLDGCGVLKFPLDATDELSRLVCLARLSKDIMDRCPAADVVIETPDSWTSARHNAPSIQKLALAVGILAGVAIGTGHNTVLIRVGAWLGNRRKEKVLWEIRTLFGTDPRVSEHVVMAMGLCRWYADVRELSEREKA